MSKPMHRSVSLALFFVLASLAGSDVLHGQEGKGKITKAGIGGDGLVHLTNSDGREFVAPREVSPVRLSGTDNVQASVEPPVIAADGRTVGWLVNFPNCCTSYPIPMVVVIWRDGVVLRRIHPRGVLPVWAWFFVDGGKKVAYRFETVHGGMGVGCELRDVGSGEILDSWSADDPSKKTVPAWAEPFRKDFVYGGAIPKPVGD